MTEDRSQLVNFVQKFLGTVKFGNDHVVKIMGYGDYQIGNMTISRVYYVEGLGHNLFSVGQFCDSDLEVAFRQHTCFIRNLDGVDLLTGSRGNNLYTLSHRRLSHLNFGAINHLARQGLVRGLLKLKSKKDHLCSACAMGKSTKKTHKLKSEDTNQEKLYLLHMDLYGPMRVESVNGKKYILVRLKVPIRHIQTDNGTEFVNQTLRDYYEEVGISHETSVTRSPQQNGVVERRNRTLIEAARTMLIYAQSPLFLWTEAVATACFTQNRSIIRLRHGKTPYELMHSKLPDLLFFHVFGALCYSTNDSENLGKLQPKADIRIFIGYAPTKKAFRIYNRRTRRIVETIHVDFDELTIMDSEQISSGPVLNEMTPVHADSTGSPFSTTVDQDAPSPSKSHSTTEIQFLVIPQDVEDDNLDIEVAHIGNDPLFGVPIPEATSAKWTKDHPLNNIIGQLSKPVSTRLQLHEQVLFCYYDAFLTSVEPKMYKEALTQSCWIEAMQEELNEFERLEVFSGSNIIHQEERQRLTSGLQISQSPRGIFINQSKYALESLKKYGFESCDLVNTPMVEKSKLDEDKEGKAVDLSHCYGMIGTLLYLTASRPDLQFAICMCARYHARPTEKYVHAVKRIFRYIRGTVNRGLWYPNDSSVALTAFTDADHVGCQDTRRITSGSVQFLGKRLISWSSKRQKSVAISNYGLGFNKIPMYCDNKSAIALCCNNVQHSRSKHIDIKYHFIKEYVENGVIELYFINIEYQLADLFTKALGRDRIEFFTNKLGMRSFTPETLKQLTDEVDE
nr:retrovirus-related Pol polyprotein from transposon TNT 1-94 [Tanacetum cinerariifolium]